MILADGTSLGGKATLNYNELAGVVGESLKAIFTIWSAAAIQYTEDGDPSASLIYEDGFDL